MLLPAIAEAYHAVAPDRSRCVLSGHEQVGVGLVQIRRLNDQERAADVRRVARLSDETQRTALEGHKDRDRPVVVEDDPAYGGLRLAKRPQLDQLALDALRLRVIVCVT